MKTLLCLLVSISFLAMSGHSHGHFLWALAGPHGVTLEVADQPGKDAAPGLFKKLSAAKLFRLSTLAAAPGNKGGIGQPKSGAGTAGASLVFGVHDDFLVNWSAKAILEVAGAGEELGLPAEIVLNHGSQGLEAHVNRDGKPVAGAEVMLWAPGASTYKKLKTDRTGTAVLGLDHGSVGEGILAIGAVVVVPKAGKHEGKAYKETRYFTTVTFNVGRP